MIEIQPIQPGQTAEAKRVVVSVARGIFQWPEPVEEILRAFDAKGELRDMDDIQSQYLDRRGLFLVALDDGRVVGTGAVRGVSESLCELKRLWLLEPYQGQGTGYALLTRLLDFARRSGYHTIRLVTDRRQARAIRFYERAGFQHAGHKPGDPDDLLMEMALR